ncbi:MAG: enoyl-CoA hydratase/isomerase family protein [Proteobacteria bacterium]|nr:enoyl-CoA hydratase/isomerase family protein [Pseudomonadota bacterium]
MALAEYEIKDKVAIVTINNPPLNALDVATKLAIEKVFIELDGIRDQMRAVVLTGGGDKAFVDLEPESAKRRLMRSHAVYSVVESFHWPVIAAIHGFCFGGGLELALCCDVRYASREAQFGFPEVKLSIFPGNGGTARARYFLGLGRFKEMVYSGETINAEQALQYGLVEKVTYEGQVMAAALELARKIAKRGPLGVAAAKKAINRNRDLPLHEGLEVESDLWAGLSVSHDMKEGATAFIEKRKPTYLGK